MGIGSVQDDDLVPPHDELGNLFSVFIVVFIFILVSPLSTKALSAASEANPDASEALQAASEGLPAAKEAVEAAFGPGPSFLKY